LPEIDVSVRRPVTAEGLTTSATPLPLDTFMVVLREVWLVPPPSNPPMSVQAVVSLLKLKLPLLWANAGMAPNARTSRAVANANRNFHAARVNRAMCSSP